jgi:beta-glucosidase
VKVTYAEGARISEPDASAYANKFAPYEAPSAEKDAALIAQAVEAARSADVVILALGENETITREALGTGLSDKPSFGDSDTLELPGRQNELVGEILKLGKPTVAVLLNGRPLSIEQLSRSVPAILEGWYLGQETGNAIAGVLFGDVNPSGHLTVTVARNVGQLPVFYYRKPSARLGYVFNSNAPLYPFGYGLSYTSFAYGKPTLDKPEIARDGTAKLSVAVTNSGARAGDEVVQMYVHAKVSSVVQPIMRLAAFERVFLRAGETKTLSFDVGPEQLAIWDRQMKHVVEAGKVDIMVGSNVQQTTSVQLEVRP